ncbi:MAG: penicillin-binding protein 2 [bacterium]|nr:penicillin-binding protein 2 [bacterium]
MFIEKRKLSKGEIKRISFTANIILIVLFIVLLFSFWSIQVLRNHYYNTLAARNITKDIEVKAPRGLILDRNLGRLSENKLNFSLFLVRQYAADIDKTIQRVQSITGMKKDDIVKKIEKYKFHPSSFTIPLVKDLPLQKVIYIESRSDEMPEFEINIEPARAYPYKEIASHILGYISQLTAGELEERKGQGYKLGDITGVSGIEKQYEAHLKGTKGIRTVAKDNLGRVRKVLNEKKPDIGNTIILTIDIEIQKYVEDIFKEHNGTIGVVDLKTGGILAMVSKPNFNPEFFSGVLDQEEWNSLRNNPDKPLHNKFLQGQYSPGSVFKPVVALAALEEDIIDPSTVSSCYGYVKIYDRNFHCWQRGGHGSVKLPNALRHSCNVYFYRVGKKLDIDILSKYAEMLGLGSLTGIDLPNEKQGRVPNKEWKLRTYKQKWFPGETISVSIGGGMINVTPIQVLTMISTIALRGKMPRLHLLKTIESDGKVVSSFEPEFKSVAIAKENFELVIEGLHRVVNDGGTGRAAWVKGLEICGKTGTQQIISKENPNYKNLVKQKRFRPHSWFVSFAPRNKPEIAMVVFVENGGDAGAIAAPIAGKIYRKIF